METTDLKVVRLEERVGTLQSDVTAIKATLAGQDDKLDRLLAESQQRKGARSVSKFMLGLVSSGGLLGWVWEHFHK
jgi:hypothetical protein